MVGIWPSGASRVGPACCVYLCTAATPGSRGYLVVVVRLLSLSDTDHYADMWADAVLNYPQFFRSTFSDDPSGEIPTRYRPDSFTLGAFDAGALIGILSLERDTKIKLGHKALVSRMFVAPSLSRAGVGRAMLQEAIHLAKQVPEIHQLYLTVLDTNLPAQSLYLSEGFEKFAHEPRAVCVEGEYIDEWQMVLQLRSEP